MDIEQLDRSKMSRVGLVVLNLLAPGFGLIRLGQLGLGAAFAFALSAGALLAIMLALVSPILSPLGYLTMLVAFMLTAGFVYVASTIRVWRTSRVRAAPMQWWQKWYALVALYGLVALVGIGVVNVGHSVYKPYYLPGASMEPTLVVDDQLVADMRTTKVSRGDVIVIKVGKFDYVKRVAAIGGDRVKLVQGVPYVNGIPSEQHVVGSYLSDNTKAIRMTERFPGETRFHEILDFGPNRYDDFSEQTVPAGHVFLLGDSRDNSADSRVEKALGGIGGTVPQANIRGRALFKTFDSHYRWVGKIVR